ncbi:related to diaminopropionate ammonia-lyase [Cephalotrichum gorgonifer]|uniref:Related to diaminopropionate ammonia-lyase n=1 Tax=Cephalotrichum gorgonifer TaxID=2041049 RepID=A0AAE8MW48_9PEZI|nr:related to diaminopropionate ammonia-lyase [Cephalotrichum gorgonifer]
MTSTQRRPIHLNPAATLWRLPSSSSSASNLPDRVRRFHRAMPGYAPTPLISLQSIASDLGVGSIHLKFEGSRFDLPSFKILGASWATYRALTTKIGLSLDSDLETLKAGLQGAATPVVFFAATDGNHGRAVARMGSILGLSRRKAPGGVLIEDTAFDGYEDIPQWVVDGYGTMMYEVDQQLGHTSPDLVIAPVGVGSFAQAVVSHYKSPDRPSTNTKVLTVESDVAPCLYRSLKRDSPDPIACNVPTIMAGLNCGTVSSNAWPLLRSGVDASLTVSDFEAHEACEILKSVGVSAGPCGAAPLAALRRLTASDKEALGLGHSSVIVLLCTEGHRDHPLPRSVAYDDPVSLCQALVQINSSVPSAAGPGETEIARYVTSWLSHRDIETHWIEPIPGRPSVVGVVRGARGGKSLMLNGHMDTVTNSSYDGDALSGHIKDGKLYGRGSADMKSGLAAILTTLAAAKARPLAGDVIFTGVADEEDMSIGTEQVLLAGWRADAAIVCEPTGEDLVVGHKGFAWFEVDILGRAAHGSRFDLGMDAIRLAGYFLVALDKYAKRLRDGPEQPSLGLPSVHASMIKGGEEVASYPAKCTITIERRTVAGETDEQVLAEVEGLLREAAQEVRDLKYDVRTLFTRKPYEIESSHPLVSLVSDQIKTASGKEPTLRTEAFWTDCALISDAGMPVVMYGPRGEGLHSMEEWADVESIRSVASTLEAITQTFCG